MVKYLLLLSRKVNKCLTKTQKIINLLKRLCTVFHCFLLSKNFLNHMSCCTIAFIQSMTWVNKAMLLWLLIYTYFSPRYKISPVKLKGAREVLNLNHNHLLINSPIVINSDSWFSLFVSKLHCKNKSICFTKNIKNNVTLYYKLQSYCDNKIFSCYNTMKSRTLL